MNQAQTSAQMKWMRHLYISLLLLVTITCIIWLFQSVNIEALVGLLGSTAALIDKIVDRHISQS